MKKVRAHVVAIILAIHLMYAAASPAAPITATATNYSTPTMYEEEDNVHIALTGTEGPVTSFKLRALHPGYTIGQDNGAPGAFPPGNDPVYPFANPGVFRMYDDGTTVINAVRLATWWRPTAMTMRIGSTLVPNVHYIQAHRKEAGAASWPQFLVVYADANVRLKPHPQPGRTDQLFGSSVLIGPGANSARPAADIAQLEYRAAEDAFSISYAQGGSARIHVDALDRTIAQLSIDVNFPGDTFARFRSMWVSDGNCDVDHVRYMDGAGALHDDPVLSFAGGEANRFLFSRQTRSVHNTSAPDIEVYDFSTVPEPSGTRVLLLIALAAITRQTSRTRNAYAASS